MPERELPSKVPTPYACPTCGSPVVYTETIDYIFNGEDDVMVGVDLWECTNEECDGDSVWWNEEAPEEWTPP